eukprot:g21619.t1
MNSEAVNSDFVVGPSEESNDDDSFRGRFKRSASKCSKSRRLANFIVVVILIDGICTCRDIDCRAQNLTTPLGFRIVSDICLAIYIGDVARALRLGRVLRLTRFLRKLRSLRELHKLATMMTTCAKTLVWSFLLCFVVMTVWSMLMVEAVNPLMQQLQQESGTFTESYPQTAIILMGSFMTLVFGVLNLVVAVVVDTFADARQNDVQNLAEEMEDEVEYDRMSLAKLFARIDADGNELIEGARKDPIFQSRLRVMDIDESDLQMLRKVALLTGTASAASGSAAAAQQTELQLDISMERVVAQLECSVQRLECFAQQAEHILNKSTELPPRRERTYTDSAGSNGAKADVFWAHYMDRDMGGKRRTIRSNGPGGGSGLPRDRRTRRERAPGTARLSEGSGFGGVSENAVTKISSFATSSASESEPAVS